MVAATAMVFALTVSFAVAGQLSLGVTVPALDADGFKVNADSARKQATAMGAAFTEFSANNSVERQISQIEDMVSQGMSAIVVNPTDYNALGTAIQKANAAKIPVVAMDGDILNCELVALVESDNVAHGRAAADLMAEAAAKAGLKSSDLVVLELLGDQATTSGVERHEGFNARAKELGITISRALPTMWQNDRAYNATLDAFQAVPDINAIFEASDIAMHAGVESALQQINRLKKIGEPGHVIIVGVDGGPNGLNSIRKGYIDGIAAQQLIVMGELSAKIALDAAQGIQPKDKIIRLQPDLTTPENVDSPDHWANQLD